MTGPHLGVQLRPGDPTRLGDYELLERLGEGGMGTVFRGRSSTGRMVAVKVVRTDFLSVDEYRHRFRSEVNRARQVPPFCTAEVLDADLDHDPPYLVVEFVDGPSLGSVIKKEGPLRSNDLHAVAIGIATALSAIHGAGVVHRDLKPDNVLLSRSGPKVIDFGIARPLEVTSNHTRTNQMVGTIAYMAPERFESDANRRITPAIDVFAWGVLVAYAATGRIPFAADSGPAMAVRIITQPPDLDGLREPLRSIVAHTLEKDPLARPTTQELLAQLTAVDRNEALPGTSTRRRPTARARGSRPPRAAMKWWSAIAVAGLVAAAVTTLTVQALLGLAPEEPISDATSTTAPAPVKADGVFGGRRRTLLHLAPADLNLYVTDEGRLKVHAGTGARSEFVLVPSGSAYLIETLAPTASTDRRCLGTGPSTGDVTVLTLGTCAPGPATQFRFVPTGKHDRDGHPTFAIQNQAHGDVEWSQVRKMLYLSPAGGTRTTVSFTDRGAVR